MDPHKISANSDNKQKSFIPKKIGVLLFETVKNLIFWIVTRVITRDYTVFREGHKQFQVDLLFTNFF